MIANQIKHINEEKMHTVVRTSCSNPMTAKEKAGHVWNCLLGNEEIITSDSGAKSFHVTEKGRNRIMAREKAMADGTPMTNLNASDLFVKVQSSVSHFCERIGRSLRRSILLVIFLLLARHFVPELGESLSGVYLLIDNFVVPVLNWCFGILYKGLNWALNLPIISNIVEFLSNIV